MAVPDPGWGWPPPPVQPVPERLSPQASVWELPDQHPAAATPPSARLPRPARPPWNQRSWFTVLVATVVVLLAAALGALLGSRVG